MRKDLGSMKKVRYLTINVTNICDMECEFCLRGNAKERKRLSLDLIPKIFEGISEIGCITITGGEPGCHVGAVTAIADYIVGHSDELTVYGMFIATNAKVYHEELVDAVKRMQFLLIEKCYSDDKVSGHEGARRFASILEEMSYDFGIAVSMDNYHGPIPSMNYMKYRLSGVYSEAKEFDYSKGGIISRGRGDGIPGSSYRPYREFYVEPEDGNIVAEEVYITVDGKVFADCDMSYEMELAYEPTGDLNEEALADVIQRYADEQGLEEGC